MDLPNVTICNFNRIDTTKAAKLNMGEKEIAYLYGSIYGAYDLSFEQVAPLVGISSQEMYAEYKKNWDNWKKGMLCNSNGSCSISVVELTSPRGLFHKTKLQIP